MYNYIYNIVYMNMYTYVYIYMCVCVYVYFFPNSFQPILLNISLLTSVFAVA
jgi:hypothetical protein